MSARGRIRSATDARGKTVAWVEPFVDETKGGGWYFSGK